VLVVGPEHVNRVEAALASSPLRFLTTQVLWQRCQLTLGGAPSTASTPSAPKTGLAGPVTAAASGGDSQENVELTIYGVVTLYDRPGRPAEKQPPPPPPPPPLKK